MLNVNVAFAGGVISYGGDIHARGVHSGSVIFLTTAVGVLVLVRPLLLEDEVSYIISIPVVYGLRTCLPGRLRVRVLPVVVDYAGVAAGFRSVFTAVCLHFAQGRSRASRYLSWSTSHTRLELGAKGLGCCY